VNEIVELRKDLKKQVEEEFEIDDESNLKKLDQRTATQHLQRIRTFQSKVID